MTILSHYTDEEGLRGIAQSQTLWARDFLCLNDTTELTYGMEAVMRKATSIAVSKIPLSLRNTLPDDHVHTLIPQFIKTIRDAIANGSGFDTLYVTSFAQGRNEDENKRGILTLWDRYTKTAGYSLQFTKDKIQQLVRSEISFRTYGLIQLVEVQYGIDETDRDFLSLAEQYALHLLTLLAQTTGDARFLEGAPQRQPESYVVSKLLLYCGSHKDPSFSDEREMRIFAFPIDRTVYDGFRITQPKTIYNGKIPGSRYIILGEDITPGLRPDRIIIGPNASLNETDLAPMFPNTIQEISPVIFKSTIPIRSATT